MTEAAKNMTPLDKARALARDYRADLIEVAPAVAHVIDQAAAAAGEHWIADITTGPVVCTTQEAALLIGVTDRRICQLIQRDQLPTAARDHRGHLLWIKDVYTYQATRNRAVAERQVTAVPSEVKQNKTA